METLECTAFIHCPVELNRIVFLTAQHMHTHETEGVERREARAQNAYHASNGAPVLGGTLPLTASSSATCASVSRQPKAPAASSTCFAFFAPGMGTAPLHMVQLMATCPRVLPPWSSATARMQSSSTCSSMGQYSVTASVLCLSVQRQAGGSCRRLQVSWSGVRLLRNPKQHSHTAQPNRTTTQSNDILPNNLRVPVPVRVPGLSAVPQGPTCTERYRSSVKSRALGPLGLLSLLYLPVSRPWHIGE